MKTLFQILACMLIACACTKATASNPDTKNGKEAAKTSYGAILKKGMEYYTKDHPQYTLALKEFMTAYEKKPNDAELCYKIGVCLINTSNKLDAQGYFEKAFRLKPLVNPKIHFFLGASHQLNNEFAEARKEYEQYLADGAKRIRAEAERTKKRIAECDMGDSLMAHPVNVKIENLGPNINSSEPEYTPHITADESQIFFTSRRKDTQGGGKDEQQVYYEDIYMSQRDANGEWQPAKNLGSALNTGSHDAAAGLSPDGHTLFVFRGDKGNGDIVMSSLGKKGFGKPKDLGKTINTSDAHESSACLSPDGNTLYFVSDKPGGRGARDIYLAKWDAAKKAWGQATNIGSPINTPYDEEAVFMHPDGKTLYFSSKGNGSMGGFDIFYSVKERNHWSKPINIGYPINSTDDDVFMEISASGEHLYFSSVKKEGLGEKDIYMATYMEVNKPKAKVTLAKGHVFDADTKQPITASIELVDLEKNERIGTFSTDASSGKFLVSLPGGKNYGSVIQADGYLFESDNFNIPDTAAYNEFSKDYYLKPIKVGSAIVLNNIFFETAKWDLKEESINELERLLGFVKANRRMKIEIAGHTDSQGSDSYNQTLSENRARSVVNWLLSKQIETTRLEFHGYGEVKPVATNDTPDGRAINRRIEFRIVSN